MTKKETAAILEILTTAYPNFYSKSNADPKMVLGLWSQMFADDDTLQVSLAVKSYIATDTSGFAPSIGAIKSRMAKQQMDSMLSESDAWTLIRQAASNGLYGAEEEFKKLPPILQTIVGDPNQLRDWAAMDSEIFNSVISSNFRKKYIAEVDKVKEQLMLPQEVKSKLMFLKE